MFDLDVAAKYIKALITTAYCIVCGKLSEKRLRYSCGHPACEDCVSSSRYCYFCLSQSPECSSPMLDENLTEQLALKTKIFNTFQKTFGIDVFQRPRLSEQLKLEKELFPQCIQAKQKYQNNRKSNVSFKENTPLILPGELTSKSEVRRMDKSKQLVQDWLNQSESILKSKRTPFSDLDVNNLRFSNKSKKQTRNLTKQHEIKTKAKTKSSNNLMSEKVIKTSLKGKNIENKHSNVLNKKNNRKVKHEQEEDKRSVILIEDSQNEVVDKDLLAWQAVVQAHNEELTDIENEPSGNLTSQKDQLIHTELQQKSQNKVLQDTEHINQPYHALNKYIVPYFKMSKLTETCEKCLFCYKTHTEISNNKSYTEKLNPNITITIMRTASTIIMKVGRNQAKLITVESKDVQTDLDSDFGLEEVTNDNHMSSDKAQGASEDVLKSVRVPTGSRSVVSDTDTESNDEHGCIMTVEALVHNSSQESNSQRRVLGELKPSRTVRPTKRRYTPNSSDSSEKENRDPNTRKRKNIGKKRKKNY